MGENQSEKNYVLRLAANFSLKRMNECVDAAQKASGKSRSRIRAEMLHCSRKFGAGFHDYIWYEFWNLDDDLRDTYLTRVRSKRLVEQMNDAEYSHYFDNKNEFNAVFSEYTKRDFVDMVHASRADVNAFYKTHKRAFAKLLDGSCGDGAELLTFSDFPDGDALYDYAKKKNFGVLEEVIENHPDIAKIYPNSLNTVRFITLIGDDGKVHLLAAAQKFGRDGRFIDVFGMHSIADPETGVITYPFHSGASLLGEIYENHPDTGAPLIGYRIPCWEETKAMVFEAAMKIPQMRYIGWDVAITPKGPLIIEGNNYTAYDYMQLPCQNPSRIGLIPTLKKIVPSYRYDK